MKKYLVLLSVVIALVFIATQAPAAERIVLRLANQWPVNNFMNREDGHLERWGRELQEATNGQVVLEIYADNSLAAAYDNYDAVVNGIADIGIVPYAYWAGRFPIVEAFCLPGVAGFNSAASAGYAINEAIDTLDPDELKDTHHMFTFSTGPNALLSNVPIRTLEDLQGLSLGVTQAERARALQLLGAVPISLTSPEWYEAIQRNLMVGGIMGYEALRGMRFYEVTGDYITNSALFASQMFYCVMNKDTYERLPQSAKDFFAIRPDYILRAWDVGVIETIQFVTDRKEIELIYLTDEETARWRERIAPIASGNIQSLNARGIDGEALHAYIHELEEKYNALYDLDLRERIRELYN